MALVEPNRRRLTVCHGQGAQDRANGKAVGKEIEDKLERAGLTDIFNAARTAGANAVAIYSMTDPELKRRQSFTDKAEEVLVPLGGASAAEGRKWLEQQGVGWTCRKGLKPESPNQDSFSVHAVENEFTLYCVYDGHGPCGHDVSDIAREAIVSYFLQHPQRDTDTKVAFEDSFLKCQRMLETTKGCDPAMSGTTCSMAYHQIKSDKLWVAHVGDSRAVLVKRGPGKECTAKDLTVDHKPDLEEEKHRIENSNPPGRVVFDGFYNHRVFAQNGMYPGLNMSRALGDVVGHKEAGLSARPDVKEIDLAYERADGSSTALLLCTDGVWEFITSNEAVSLVMNYDTSKAKNAVEELARLSWDRWMDDSDNEISDDITGILVHLQKSQPH